MFKILGVILVSTGLMAALPQQKPFTIKGSVENAINRLTIEVLNTDNLDDKFTAIARALEEIRVMRDGAMPQNERDEAQMSLMVGVIDSLPDETEFRRSDCNAYMNDFLNQYEPLAEETPHIPAVKPGWIILQSLCR